MALKVPRASSLVFMDAIIAALLEGCELCAFQNNYTPIDTTVIGDLTEATFDGYARITLSGWPSASLDANNKASTAKLIQSWTKSIGATTNTVYGIYVLDGSGNLLYAERNPAGGVLVNTVGQLYSYIPIFTDKTEV